MSSKNTPQISTYIFNLLINYKLLKKLLIYINIFYYYYFITHIDVQNYNFNQIYNLRYYNILQHCIEPFIYILN